MTDQPRLCLFSQTPPLRLVRDDVAPMTPLARLREGEDYLVSPGGVTRMLQSFLAHLMRRRAISGGAWLALANHAPVSVALAHGVPFHPVRLTEAERPLYAHAKGAIWNAVHGLSQGDPDVGVVRDGLALLARTLGARARELHAERPFDLFYVHDFQLLPLARHLPPGVPRVFRWHIPFTRLPPALEKLVVDDLNQYHAVIVSCEGYARRLRDAGVRVPIHAAHPYTGELRQRVVTSEDVAAFEGQWGLQPGDPLFLLVARLDPMKSQDDAIRAFAKLAPRHPRARLMLVGGGGFSGGRQGLGMAQAGEWRTHLETLARDLGVADRVILTGTLPEADLEVAYTRARAVLLPSRIEGFGLAAVEGWLYGHPAVVSRGAGVAELIHEGENGYSFEPGDVDALADAMRALVTDAAHADRLGRVGRETARSCEAREATRHVWRILQNVMERSRATRRLNG